MTEELIQGSDGWLKARAGRITASKISAMLAKGEGKTREKYRNQLVAERLSGNSCEDGYQSVAMANGSDQEQFARAAYEVASGIMLDTVGFVAHPRLMAGCSPDGLVGEDGMAQFKCPLVTTHVGYMIGGKVPTEYVPQMQWEMACTGRKWSDFVSFSALMPAPTRLFTVRLLRDDDWIAKAEAEAEKFDAEVQALVDRFKF